MYGVTGTFNKQIVFKKRKGQQYISARPDTTNVIPTDKQTFNSEHFANAVAAAKAMAENPPVELPFTIKEGQTLYQAAIGYYRRVYKNIPPSNPSKKRYTIQMLKDCGLSEKQIKAVMYLQKNGKLTNSICRSLSGISKPSASRLLKELVDSGIIKWSGLKGTGSSYQLVQPDQNMQ